MDLMETKVSFRTEELFRNLIDVSKYNLKQYSYVIAPYQITKECASIISLGRQKGATTAIANIASQGFDDAITVIVVPNSRVRQTYQDIGIFEESQQFKKDQFKTLITSITSSQLSFRGVTSKPKFDKMNIIFDCCELKQACEYVQEINRNSVLGRLKINSVLINQPM